MELKPGYKKTEVGVIPEEWEVKRLRDVASLVSNRANPINLAPDVPCIELEHIEPATGCLIGKSSAGESISLKALFKANDILFGRLRAYLQKYWFAKYAGVCSTEIWVLRANPSHLTSTFLFHLVRTDHFINSASTAYGTHMPRSDWSVINRLELTIPSLPEQIAIATVLSDMDSYIESLAALITKKRLIKQGARQELLAGKRRLPGFQQKPGYKQTEVGVIPEDWEVRNLGSLCSLTTGRKDVNEGDPNGDFPFFTCSKLHTYSNFYSFDTEAILVAGNGDVGNLHYFNGKFEAYQRTYVLHDFSINIKFIWYQMNAKLSESLGLGKIGSSIPYIKKDNLTSFLMPIPVYSPEQTAIATVLSDMDSEIEALESKLSKARDLKQGMMQELLTGRIRLV